MMSCEKKFRVFPTKTCFQLPLNLLKEYRRIAVPFLIQGNRPQNNSHTNLPRINFMNLTLTSSCTNFSTLILTASTQLMLSKSLNIVLKNLTFHRIPREEEFLRV